MTDNRTTELRERLDELGIEHADASYKRHMPITVWTADGATLCYVEGFESTDLHIDNATPEQSIAATLGSGRLTAEQVCESAHGHYELRMVRDVDGLDVPQVVFDWRAIADELNAKLGSGTCENDWAEFGKFKCSECGLQVDSISTGTTMPVPITFCPRCGKKVE